MNDLTTKTLGETIEIVHAIANSNSSKQMSLAIERTGVGNEQEGKTDRDYIDDGEDYIFNTQEYTLSEIDDDKLCVVLTSQQLRQLLEETKYKRHDECLRILRSYTSDIPGALRQIEFEEKKGDIKILTATPNSPKFKAISNTRKRLISLRKRIKEAAAENF